MLGPMKLIDAGTMHEDLHSTTGDSRIGEGDGKGTTNRKSLQDIRKKLLHKFLSP
jgi:hypothetical protein